MVKIKAITRTEESAGSSSSGIHKHRRNLDPSLHPFQQPREYVRALNATKLQKVFARPFVAALSGHTDGVYSMARHPTAMSCLLSGSCDGELKVWDVSKNNAGWTVPAHRGYVRGIAISPSGTSFVTCGEDKYVKIWRLDPHTHGPAPEGSDGAGGQDIPEHTFLYTHAFTDVSYSPNGRYFATAGGNVVNLWEPGRSEPMHSMEWGVDSVLKVKVNPIEADYLISCMSDRALVLYDARMTKPATKVIQKMRSNSVSWNPQETYMYSSANEDGNCYTWDIRRFHEPVFTHYDHVAAVLDLDYSPTGKEFVSGSFDKSLRIFPVGMGHRTSREVYHTKRMQRIFTVKYSGDARFVLSGSDDTNIRVWKAQASLPLAPLAPREREKLEYNQKLKDKFAHMPEIKRIARHRHLPQAIHAAKVLQHTMKEAQKRRDDNVKRHNKRLASKEPERASKRSIVGSE
eukprot:TRINITY_DN5820_c0_g1_i3.p1 TRINITY_DN5820_c0_g1~~TRINITY_DN5820_c0_g1_i3.p1  ORF type:complete len:459 (+),score=87.17 TRINITY_DN5820_c0_g1_i3:38-1414(+)